MPQGKQNKRSLKATLKRGRSVRSIATMTGSVEEQTGSKKTAFHNIKTAVVKTVTKATVSGISPLLTNGTTPNNQRRASLISIANTENGQQFSLSEIAEKLRDRELFPEKMKRAKAFLENLPA